MIEATNILVADLVPNGWNPNIMPEDIYLACKNDIKRIGVKQPLILWKKNAEGKRIIIDGEHRWKIAEELGITEVPWDNMEHLSEVEAKILTITMNRFRGEFDQIKLAQLIADIGQVKTREELEGLLGMSQEQLQSMEDLLKMDFDQFKEEDVLDNIAEPESGVLLNDFIIQVDLLGLDIIETSLSVKGGDRASALVEICRGFLKVTALDKYKEVKERAKGLISLVFMLGATALCVILFERLGFGSTSHRRWEW